MIEILPVKLSIEAPYLTRSNNPGSYGVDTPLARDARGGLIIPGSHIIGKISHAMRDLADIVDDTKIRNHIQLDLLNLFGTNAQSVNIDKVSGREDRRNISASDFILKNVEKPHSTRTRIARDNATMTVMEGMLQVIEQPFKFGETLEFEGELRFFYTPDADQLNRVKKAFQYVLQFGGLRSVGFGSSKKVEFETFKTQKYPTRIAESFQSLCLQLDFKDPFCTGEARNDPNTYTSALYVPGGAIKGAIARQVLTHYGLKGFIDENEEEMPSPPLVELARNFDGIRIRHGVSSQITSEKKRRPAVYPASLSAIEIDDQIHLIDLASLPDASNPVLIEGQPPLSLFDFKPKHRDIAKKVFGFSSQPKQMLRVRTQIDASRRAAMTNRLFGVEYTRNDEHKFIAQVDIPDSADKQNVADALTQILSNGLAGVGRGGAYADVSLTSTTEEYTESNDDRVVVVLQSSALLRDPASDGQDLCVDYEQGFRKIGLPNNWALSAVFVEETLAGGSFMKNRRPSKSLYQPWLLTKPGGVFVFERQSGDVPLPKNWFEYGLDVPATVLDHYGLKQNEFLYRECPYLPQNGYGEVTHGVQLANGRLSHEALNITELGFSYSTISTLEETA